MKKIRLTAQDIARAYNSKKHYLVAHHSKGCCPGVPDRWVVMNQGVVLRQMLEVLGFFYDEIDKHLHDQLERGGE